MAGLIVGVAGFAAGFLAARRWAPPLAPTRVGNLAALVVALLTGAALAVAALDVYGWVDTSGVFAGFEGVDQLELVGPMIRSVCVNAAPLLAFAAIVHLLAPPPEDAAQP